jgi:5-methylcytosine-specific restriction endonuclease McrBC regulatory subunit McrC
MKDVSEHSTEVLQYTGEKMNMRQGLEKRFCSRDKEALFVCITTLKHLLLRNTATEKNLSSGFEVFTAVPMNAVFWDVAPC